MFVHDESCIIRKAILFRNNLLYEKLDLQEGLHIVATVAESLIYVLHLVVENNMIIDEILGGLLGNSEPQ